MATAQPGRLHSRPHKSKNLGSSTTGLRRTGLDTQRDGILYVPESFNPKVPSPLIVTLHGAGGNAMHALAPFKDLSDHTGTILLAPESQKSTWDLIVKGYGEDVFWIDEALSDAFSLYNIDSDRLAIAGFSDGASYALSLGITNGDVFSHILAFSPGFVAPAEIRGAPSIFVSHGVDDQVLRIASCSRKLVPALEQAGLEVVYREFEGGHIIPDSIAKEAFAWVVGNAVIENVPKTAGRKGQSPEPDV
jgi:phospholipase/carboxylesterase